MKKIPRTVRYLLLLLLCVALYAGGRSFLYWNLERIIVGKIAAAQSGNISIQYGSLHVDYWKGALTIDSLNVRLTVSDTVCRICGHVSRVTVDGIAVLPLLFKKEVELQDVVVIGPSVRYDNRYSMPSRKGRKPNSLKGISVNRVTIDSAHIELTDSTTHAVATEASADILVEDFHLRFDGDESMQWSVGDVKVSGIAADFRKALYHLSIREMTYNRNRKEFRMDSLHVVPAEKRDAFAKKIGHQVDQFTFVLPLLAIDGLELDSTERLKLRANHVGMSFNMEVYRDKRYYLKHRKPRQMPVTMMRQMSLAFKVDSISVYPSYVSYEEFPEKGESTGKIFFDSLKASIYNLSNDSSHESAEMRVHSNFMNAGKLNAVFTFPLTGKKPYTVQGALSDFAMPSINSMLIPAGNIKVESGNMREMKFRFQYNSFRSDGELEVNYSDLKVVSLNKDDRKPNKILSFLIGVFVKKDIDRSDTKDKRTGQIQWERDTQKGILNYWWKSVLSGVKSVYNLDVLTGKKDEKGKKKS